MLFGLFLNDIRTNGQKKINQRNIYQEFLQSGLTAYFFGLFSFLSLANGSAIRASRPIMIALSVTYSGWLERPIKRAMDSAEKNVMPPVMTRVD